MNRATTAPGLSYIILACLSACNSHGPKCPKHFFSKSFGRRQSCSVSTHGVLCRSARYEALANPAMARLWCFKWLTTVNRRGNQLVAFPCATRSSSISSHSGRSHQQRQKQLWEDLFSKPSAWWDNRLDKKNPRAPDFVCKVTRSALWLDNQHKPKWVDAQLDTLGVQPQGGLGGAQWSLSKGSGRPGDAIERLCLEGKLDRALDVLMRMDEQEAAPSVNTYRALLKVCVQKKALAQAKRVHAHLYKHGMESTRVLGESLVNTFVKCGGLEEALQVFHRLEDRTVFSWTAVISGYATSGKGQEALFFYHWMQEEGVQPDTCTFVNILKACGSIADLKQGRRIHADAFKYRCEDDLFVRTSLIDMYGKCGSTLEARKLFDELSRRDVVAWNAILMAYAEQGHADEALQLYDQMQEEGVSPNNRTFVSILQACGTLGENSQDVGKQNCLRRGKAVHAQAQERGYTSDVFVGSTLVSMYGRCGSIVDAREVFDGLARRNVVSWNALLVAYAQGGKPAQALELYSQMLVEEVSPDVRTFVSALQACGMLAEQEEDVSVGGRFTKPVSLEMGKAIHDHARQKGYHSDVFVGNTLISMYGKSKSIVDAREVFDRISRRNVVSWNAMLMAYVQQGEPENVLELYDQLHEEGISPNDRTFVSTLQACVMLAVTENVPDGQSTKLKALEKGKAVHLDARMKGYVSDAYVGSTLVTLYAKCGCILTARNVFDGIDKRDVVSWNAMLSAYTEQGQPEIVLQLYGQMQEQGLSPDVRTFVIALQACCMLAGKEGGVEDCQCNKLKYGGVGKEIHVDAQTKGYGSDVFVGSSLISMYGKCGSIVHARKVFDGLSRRDVVSWNAMLRVYTEDGQAEEALQLYQRMGEDGLSPDIQTFMNMLQACSMLAEKEESVFVGGKTTKTKALEKGRAIHADTRKQGYTSDVFVGSSLISMYAKCGSIFDARNTFDELLHQDIVVWSAMLLAYAEQGQAEEALQLYEHMRKEGPSPDVRTFVSVLQACCMLAAKEETSVVDGNTKTDALEKGKAIHADAKGKGYDSDVFVGSTLVSMYGKCGSIVEAQNVFDGLSQRNVVSWNAMLVAYAEQGEAEKAMQLYEQMPREGVSPNNRTFVSALQACGMLAEKGDVVDGRSSKLKYLERGKAIHADAKKKGCGSDVFVGSTLISMYGKCGSIVDAEDVFNMLSREGIVAWNAMLKAYTEQGQAEEALHLYRRSLDEGVSPDVRTFLSTIQACAILADNEESLVVDGKSTKPKSLEKGRAVHVDAQRRGCGSDVFVGSALISMYGKCGSSLDAENVFSGLSQRDVVSWNSLLASYTQQGEGEKALQLYRQMQEDGMSPDEITLVCVLQACSNTGTLVILRQVHHTLTCSEKDLSPCLASSLIGAYARCARMVDAQGVFDALPQPDAVSWNALIAGYAREGNCAASLLYYKEMQLAGNKPSGATFLSVISACSHAGLVDEGLECFESMSRDHNITPDIYHYATIVDLLCRAGCFSKVEDLISTMPMEPDLSMWLCLLGACRKHGKVVLGERAFSGALSVEPKHAAAYVLMSNIYADAGLLDLAEKVKKSRQRESAWKRPGQSWVEHEQEVHRFSVDDRKHPQQKRLYGFLGTVTQHPRQIA